MSGELAARVVVGAFEVYLATGALCALVLLSGPIARLDPGVASASWTVRLFLLPGTAVFWPLLVWRWFRRAPPPIESNAHRRAAARAMFNRTSRDRP